MDDHDTAKQKPRVAIRFRTWSELLIALRECQDSHPSKNTSFITQRVLNCLVQKLVLPCPTFQLSSNTRKPTSLRNKYSPTTWWFEHLVFLNIHFVNKLIKTMISHDLGHGIISKFLFYYRKYKFLCAKPAERRDILEAIIGLLCLLNGRSISFKGLFNVYQSASSEKVDKKYKNMLENLIGSQLDQATLDYLLVPSPRGKSYIYDVNMVLTLVKSFLVIVDRCSLPVTRLSKVGRLMDSYLSEVALDSKMKYSKFSALVMTLPDCARESHDGLYQAMDMYFEVHNELCEESKTSLCCALNYEKLSTEALKHLARNSKFPSRISVKAFMAQSSKLTSLIREIYHLKSFTNYSWFRDTSKEIKHSKDDNGKKFDADMEEVVHRSEVELNRVCWTTYSRTPRMSASCHGRYLPKLCGC